MPSTKSNEEPQADAQPPKRRVMRNTLNDLTAKEWLPETISVWIQKGLGAKHPDTTIEREHPAPFSFTDVARLVRFFTKEGAVVLDPFVGVGSTLKACALNGREGIGIELNPRYAELSRQRLLKELESLKGQAPAQTVLEGDAREVLLGLETDSVDFLVTSPPYWNILHKKDHKARQERSDKGLDTQYGDDKRDLGNIDDYQRFIQELSGMLVECARVLRPKKYAAIVVSDFRDGGQYHMFHADLANSLQESGPYQLKGITVLYQRHKRVFPYGYPSAYVPNVHHQYILILRNEK